MDPTAGSLWVVVREAGWDRGWSVSCLYLCP